MRRIRTAAIVFGLVTPSLCTSAAVPTTATTTSTSATAPMPIGRRAAAPARHPAIQAAIAELTREIDAALRSGADAPREQSDYFASLPTTDLPPAAVVAALRRPISSDPRVAAYVKWQLLSGLPASPDAKTVADLVTVYRAAAPAPLSRPGMNKAQRDELDRMIRNARKADADALIERFEEMTERWERDNRHILAYRDALFAKLPPSYDGLATGFEDAVARMNAGIDPADHAKVVLKAIESWTTTSTTPPPAEQLQAVSQALRQLEKRKGQEFYSALRWSDSTGKLSWSKSRESLSGVSSQLEDVQEFLDEKIKSPDAPLKLKEEN